MLHIVLHQSLSYPQIERLLINHYFEKLDLQRICRTKQCISQVTLPALQRISQTKQPISQVTLAACNVLDKTTYFSGNVTSPYAMNGKCFESFVIYKATLNTSADEKLYYGSCATTFKARFSNHIHSFRKQHKRNATKLSKAVWNCKDAKTEPVITWFIVYCALLYRNGARRCLLCLAEKLFILQADQKSLLKKRSEIISKCRHKNKLKLKNPK